jgi:hypothetical protein
MDHNSRAPIVISTAHFGCDLFCKITWGFKLFSLRLLSIQSTATSAVLSSVCFQCAGLSNTETKGLHLAFPSLNNSPWQSSCSMHAHLAQLVCYVVHSVLANTILCFWSWLKCVVSVGAIAIKLVGFPLSCAYDRALIHNR